MNGHRTLQPALASRQELRFHPGKGSHIICMSLKVRNVVLGGERRIKTTYQNKCKGQVIFWLL